MNNYFCTLKIKNPSPKYGCRELTVNIQDLNVYYARKNLQFQYPEYHILKIEKKL